MLDKLSLWPPQAKGMKNNSINKYKKRVQGKRTGKGNIFHKGKEGQKNDRRKARFGGVLGDEMGPGLGGLT